MIDKETPAEELQKITRPALKAAVSLIPFVGTFASEMLGEILPDMRARRIDRLFHELDRRLEHIEAESLRLKFRDPVKADLAEDGIAAAARALSPERIEYIAKLVATGIDGDEKQVLESKRLLRLLNQLDDGQVVLLANYLHKNRNDKVFQETHKDLLQPTASVMESSREELDINVVKDLGRSQLVNLGLLRGSYRKPSKGQLPEFDYRTGTLKAGHRELSPLGRLLLKQIGLAEENDLGIGS